MSTPWALALARAALASPATASAGLWLAAAVILLVTLALGVMTSLSTRALRAGFRPRHNLLLEPADLIVRLGLILLLAGVAWAAGIDPEQLGWTMAGWGWQIALGLPLGLLLAWALHLWGEWGERRGGAGAAGFQPADLLQWLAPRSRREALLVMLALFPAALLEELLFRSLWVGAASLVAPLWVAILVSALLFGWMHSAQGRVGVAATAATGILLGLLFVWAGSLLLPLVTHYVANAAQLLSAARHAPPLPEKPSLPAEPPAATEAHSPAESSSRLEPRESIPVDS
jgi:membrane protease YdiL (CAAX protease family)